MAPQHGRIPQTFIKDLLSRVDIVALIQESVQLKKRGNNYTAPCPFHNEKTPSFTVSPTKQFFHCFGCGKNGDAIEFLVAHHGLSFMEALEKLALQTGMTVPKSETLPQNPKRTNQLKVLDFAAKFYTKQWRSDSGSKLAADYLKQRGLTGKIAKDFAVGYAPAGWHAFDKACQGELREAAFEVGLIMRNDKGQEYDRFRNRVLFPIRSYKGDVIGFGARALGDDKPKYLNSPESEVFHKGAVLYGLYEALKQRNQWQTAYVVEGYMDVIALAQNGVTGAVASMGTALTSQHLQTLFRYVQDILFCFDGDNAGQQAAFKALETVLPLMQDGRRVRFMFMPHKTDPDSYIRRHGQSAFYALVQQSVPLSEYLFGQLAKKYPLDSVDGCAYFAKEALVLLNQLPDGLFKNMMKEQLNVLVGAKQSLLPSQNRRERAFSRKLAPPRMTAPTYLIAAILLQQSALLSNVPQEMLSDLDMPGLALLQSVVSMSQQFPNKPFGAYLKALQKRGFTLQPLLESNKRIELLPKEALAEELKGAVQRLQQLYQRQKFDQLLLKATHNSLNEREKQLIRQFFAD